MSDQQRAEKLASAKKKLKQFQQKHRDVQSESGRSTPSKKKHEQDGFEKPLHSENGGSTYSLSHSENLSSNISVTDSPVLTLANSIDNLCHTFNGNTQPDILNTTSGLNSLPKVSESLFKTPSPHTLFTESPPLVNSQSGSEFFDNLTSSNDPPDLPNDPSQESSSLLFVNQDPRSLLNTGMFQSPQVNASTPDGPHFQDTPNYSFPDVSFSPIRDSGNNKSSEVLSHELELQLKNARNVELENELSVQKNQVSQLQNVLEDMKKKAEEGASTLRHHVQAIQILVSEKTELQNNLEKQQEELTCKTGEVGELQGRLRASRHRVADLERELALAKTQLQCQETSIRGLESQQTASTDQTETQRKRIGDLELEISDLQSKLESRDDSLKRLKTELEEKISKLGLYEIRIQQLSGGSDSDGAVEMDNLRCKNEELLNKVLNLERQLSANLAMSDESVKEYQRYVNRLHTELQELKTEYTQCEGRCRQLEDREHQLIQQVNGLERQLSKVPPPSQATEVLPELHSLHEQLRIAEETSCNLSSQLQQKDGEVECLRVGLQERALRIQELEMTITRLENELPDTANLQAAIESDKVAASRAMAQNNTLKKQLEEMEDTMGKLNADREELTRRLEQERQTNEELAMRLRNLDASVLDSKKCEEAEKAQQTESPLMQESQVQTQDSQPVVSPEIMTKLEDKVRKTMGEIADLKEEKQRLEHLVLQLQGETETIGEYITLYQIQRRMLRQRAQEKDEQVEQLARDKEALRNKLTHLNCLVQRLVGQQTPNITGVVESEAVEEHGVSTNPSELPLPPPDSANKETADQIRSLLTEIGSNNLVTTNLENTNINFHPCPLCSGRLITV